MSLPKKAHEYHPLIAEANNLLRDLHELWYADLASERLPRLVEKAGERVARRKKAHLTMLDKEMTARAREIARAPPGTFKNLPRMERQKGRGYTKNTLGEDYPRPLYWRRKR